MRLGDLLHARRRDAVADEGGFALIAVLAVIAFTGITIAALLGMMITTMRVTSAQERTARERRASDGAIENAIEKMRTSQCDPAAQPFLADQTVSGVEVDVLCSSDLAGGSSTDQVRLVGVNGYNGDYRTWNLDCATNAAAPGCLPWSAAGASPGTAAAGDVSLVHSGNAPLDFDSGVTVRRGAVGLRTDSGGDPAIRSGGEYNQGRPGIPATSGTDCGLLAGPGPGRIQDSSGAPACGVAAAASLSAESTANVASLVAPTAPVTVPACSGAVVTFQPGTYDAAQTAAVSALTGGGTCTNRTFHFSPGIYSFQGNELRFSDPGSYYVFGAPAGGWTTGGVQSVPGLVTDGSSMLCNPEASGTSIVTAGWTRLVHTGGRVAICPNRPPGPDADPHPAIFQQTSVPNGVTITNPPSTNNVGMSFNCRLPYFNWNGDHYPVHWDLDEYNRCLPIRSYALNLQTAGAAPVQSLRLMLTGNEDSTPNNFITARDSRFTVFPASGPQLCSTGWVAGIPNGGLTSSFDLKTLGGCSTAAFTQNQMHNGRIVVEHRMFLTSPINQPLTIRGAAIEVNAHMGQVVDPADVTSADWNNPSAVARADSASATPRMPCADFICQVNAPAGALVADTTFDHELQMTDFEFPSSVTASATQDPLLNSLRAVVRVRPSAATLPGSWTSVFNDLINTSSFLLPSTSYLELRSPAGARCIVQGSGMNSDQEIAFDLLDVNREDPDSGPNCNNFVFTHASQLDDLTLTLRFEMPCIPDWLHNVPWQCLRSNLLYDATDSSPIWQMRPPDIESVRLSTVTDNYGFTSTSSVVSNATGGAASSSFNVYGMAWMPLTDLDIAWRGPATSAPLFANDLVLNGLGSRMFPGSAMGTVCCKPPTSRTLEFTAQVDGVDRMVARVHFDDSVRDPVTNRSQVDVLRWLNCGGACASVLAESDVRPPG